MNLLDSNSTVIFTASGRVYYRGINLFNDTETYIEKLTPFLCFNGKNVISMTSIHSKGLFVGCVTESGEVFTWGYGFGGYLGHGDTSIQSTPKLVEALSGIRCKQIVSGINYYFIVLTDGGKLYSCGSGSYGQLGHGDEEDKNLPSLIHALETIEIKDVQHGNCFTMALSESGFVYTWGFGDEGGLGYDQDETTVCKEEEWDLGYSTLVKSRCWYAPLPRLVEGIHEHNVSQISAFARHCAVLVDASPSPVRLAQRLHFNNKEHSDVTFMVENKPIYANIDVLSRKSEYFEAMFRSKMKESIDRVVVIPDVSQGAFLKLLEYLCLDDFRLPDDDDVLEELILLGDMYLLEGLRLLSLERWHTRSIEVNALWKDRRLARRNHRKRKSPSTRHDSERHTCMPRKSAVSNYKKKLESE